MPAITNLKIFSGHGQAGIWNDAANWTNGVVPGAADTALFTQSATINGPVEVSTLMLIGAETMTINGAIKTDSTNSCEGFMVCQQSNVTFNAASTLTDAGGFEVGVHGTGMVTVDGASGAMAAARLTMVDVKIGQFAGAVGTLNLAGSMTTNGNITVGVDGQGTMNVSGNGQVNTRGILLGERSGATGQLNLTGHADITVGTTVQIGTAVQGAPGGTGALSLGAGTTLTGDAFVSVGAGSTVTMAGGTLAELGGGVGITLGQGSTLSGYGTVSSTVHGTINAGTLASAGGTLVVQGNLSGMGAVQVGAGSTLDLVASRITAPTIAFLGTGGTLELTEGVHGAFSIANFTAGDQLVMNGIDHATWNGSNTLNLLEHGQVVDQLTLTGVAANAVFSVTPAIGGNVIALMPSHH